jgi:EAL domain-containing protein (putative c-di-GMP-specific phosphodiesterase class I)
MTLAVNISARQLADARLLEDVQEALHESGVEPAQLQLEITEGVATADPKLTMAVLSHLRHLGVGVVLDNFGNGSASLTALRQFSANTLKIDRTLVRDMMSDRAVADIVELIVTMAQKMHLEVIAEGVETVRQVENLLKMGCQCGQGYFFSQPLDAKEAQEFMRAGLKTSAAAAK